jgi:hypothetical protein
MRAVVSQGFISNILEAMLENQSFHEALQILENMLKSNPESSYGNVNIMLTELINLKHVYFFSTSLYLTL